MSAVEALQGGSHVAVFVLGDSGMGKSTAHRRRGRRSWAPKVTPVPIHGSASLTKVPYGVLGPFIVGLPVQEATSQLAVLRTLWSHLEEQKRATQKPLLLVVDDAHDLDEATAGILAELAAAGWAKLLVGSAARPGLPEPLLQLWFEGIAERHDLRPLTLAQTTEMLEGELGSQVLPNVAEILWEASGGNPMLLNGLLDDAKNDGTLLRRNGVWLFTRHLNSHGDRLTDVVRRQLLLRSPEERQALNLVALAEPVSRELIESVAGEDAVGSLIDSELIRVTDTGTGELRLWHTVYGDTLRNLISPARSLQLRQSLLRQMDSEPTSAEGLLRQVSWSIECGAEVEDRQLLRAAVLASRLYEDELARKAAVLVKDPELQMAARAVIARTRYNASDYVAARDILDADFGAGKQHPRPADRIPPVGRGACPRWATRRQRSCKRAQVLRRAGERLAAARPDDAEAIHRATEERLETMEAMVLALAGEYPAAPAASAEDAAAGTPPDPPSNTLEAGVPALPRRGAAPGRRQGTERPRRDDPGHRGRRGRSR